MWVNSENSLGSGDAKNPLGRGEISTGSSFAGSVTDY